MNFTTKVYLPISKQTVHIKEMTMQQFGVLQKYLLENDDADVSNCFKQIAQQCCMQDIEFHTNIDVFFVLCKIRSISLGDEVSFSVSDANIKCSLEHTINQLSKYNFNLKDRIHVGGWNIREQIYIDLNAPCSLNINDYADVIGDVIKTINGVDVSKEKHLVLDKLPSDITDKCLSYISRCSKSMRDCWFIEPNTIFSIPGINFNAFNNSMLEILKFIFKDDLMNTYNIKYILTSKLNISPDVADGLTPAECRLYISLLNDEISKQNKQLQEQSNQHKYPI